MSRPVARSRSAARPRAAGQAPPALQHEIGKRRPFDHPEQEAHLNLVRTESVLRADFDRLFDAHGLSGSAYNILRILRGSRLAGDPHGQPCHAIGERMVVRVPDVTRLVDRLEQRGLVERRRCSVDRRVVYVVITRAGLELLKALDEPVLELHRRQLGHLSRHDLRELNRLLVLARARVDPEPARAVRRTGNSASGSTVNTASASRHHLSVVSKTEDPPASGRSRRPGSAGQR